LSSIQFPNGRNTHQVRTQAPVAPSSAPAPNHKVETQTAARAVPVPAAQASAVLSNGHTKATSSTMNLRMAELAAPAKTEVASLDATQLANVVNKKATCPFIASAVKEGSLPVRNNADTPLASIADVASLGNLGGGDLGELLKLFAKGNHSRMPAPHGQPAPLTPSGHFSLDFPGSQGSHPGHSGVLQGDPAVRDSGRFSSVDMERLLARAGDGFLTTSEVAKFIAENLERDPASKVLGKGAAKLLLGDAGETLLQTGPAMVEALKNAFREVDSHDENVKLYEKLTKTLGEDNLIGSAGEFGLLFALLANSPKSARVDGEVAISAEDVKSMFIDKKFPEGWERWPKTRHDWVTSTAKLTAYAAAAYHFND